MGGENDRAPAATVTGGAGTPLTIVVTWKPVISGGPTAGPDQVARADESVEMAPTSLGAAGGPVRNRLSAVFKRYPDVLSSAAEVQAMTGITTMLTSEGTMIRYEDGIGWW